MSRAVTKFEEARPLDEWESLLCPFDPMSERDDRRDRVVGEGKTVIKMAIEEIQQAGEQTHNKK